MKLVLGKEFNILKRLKTPAKIQDFLDSIPQNHEKNGETYMSPLRTLKENKAHCLEGALLSALTLWMQGEEPLLLDLKAPGDKGGDHVVSLYKKNGYWGAISKTNHAVLRFRDPVYKTIRELALSYFHEYFDNKTGKKMLRQYSKPFNLKTLGTDWITDSEDMFYLAEKLDEIKHFDIVPKKNISFLRKADKMERKAGSIIEWR